MEPERAELNSSPASMEMNDSVFFADEPMVFHLAGMEAAHENFRSMSP